MLLGFRLSAGRVRSDSPPLHSTNSADYGKTGCMPVSSQKSINAG